MERRQLGRTDLEITPIGLGAWAIGGGDWCLGWGPQNDADSIATIRRAVDRGINWIDTAGVYGLGRSERIIARALRGVSQNDRPYVFTTCGFAWDDLGNVSRNLTAPSIRRQVEDSLRRLTVDVLDMVQLDASPRGACRVPWQGGSPREAWAALADLQRAGTVRVIGVSNCSAAQVAELGAIARVASVQAPYSLVRPDIEAELLPVVQRRGISALAASPMASGLLTGAMTPVRQQQLPCNDWRRGSPHFTGDELARANRIVDQLRRIGEHHGVVPGAVAIAWALRHPAVTATIAGARRPGQVDELASAAPLRLTEDDIANLTAEQPIER